MLPSNTNIDPFVAFDALRTIDSIVKEFIKENEAGDVNEKTLEFLRDLRIYCRSIYYKEPGDIEEAKSMIIEEENNA